MIKVTVFKTVNLDLMGVEYPSISGGIATHSFDKIDTHSSDTVKSAVEWIKKNYGTPFVFHDRLELELNEFETLSFYLDKIEMEKVSMDSVLNEFPDFEIY